MSETEIQEINNQVKELRNSWEHIKLISGFHLFYSVANDEWLVDRADGTEMNIFAVLSEALDFIKKEA